MGDNIIFSRNCIVMSQIYILENELQLYIMPHVKTKLKTNIIKPPIQWLKSKRPRKPHVDEVAKQNGNLVHFDGGIGIFYKHFEKQFCNIL